MRRWTVVGLLVGLVVVASCSSSSTTTSTASEPAPIQVVFQPFETSRQPADDVDQVVALARPDLVKAGVSVLVPKSLPSGAGESTGRIAIIRREPFNQVSAEVSVTFTRDQQEEAISLSTYQACEGHPTCTERTEGMTGWEGTRPVEVRSSPGCMFTNMVGLSFIDWDDGSHWYHVETYMEPDDAISWLATWTPLS